jgi:hypothetical protein
MALPKRNHTGVPGVTPVTCRTASSPITRGLTLSSMRPGGGRAAEIDVFSRDGSRVISSALSVTQLRDNNPTKETKGRLIRISQQ